MPEEMPLPDRLTQSEQEKFYRIYREYTIKYGTQWARKLGKYEKKRTNPFSSVTREVNAGMRRYLGGERYAKYIDLLEYLILEEGLLIKDENNRLDVPLATFQMWVGP